MDTGPLLINILGVQAPALSLIIGLVSVILTRVMLIAKEPRDTKGWWFYNVSLTLLLTLMTFILILDRKLGPGLSLVMGVGIGASGVVIVDVMRKKAEDFIQGFNK